MNLLASLETQNKPKILFLGLVLTCVIGITDYLSGNELSFSVFYVLPISLIAWFTNKRYGLGISLISALVWLIAEIATREPYSSSLIPVWNTLIRLTFYVIITLLLSALREAVKRESELARIDYLTGAVNLRFFTNLAQMEIDRFQRYQHPFTLAYMDLDNFKTVNDKFGHAAGDQVLRTVASAVKGRMRITDIFARLGGDEFVLLLPETNQDSARSAVSKIHNGLMKEMKCNGWPLTFSIGVLTCEVAPPSTSALVKMADELMYSVKHEHKDAVKYSVFAG